MAGVYRNRIVCGVLQASCLLWMLTVAPLANAQAHSGSTDLKVTTGGYLQGHGASVLLDSMPFSPIFYDQKDSGLQVILHDHRIATDGSLRFSPTPEQWSRIPHVEHHRADREHNRLLATSSYPAFHLRYHVAVTPEPGGFRISVNLDRPLPSALVAVVSVWE